MTTAPGPPDKSDTPGAVTSRNDDEAFRIVLQVIGIDVVERHGVSVAQINDRIVADLRRASCDIRR